MNRRQVLTASASGLAFNAICLVAHGFAQLGGRSTRILVGFPPGGTSDVIARLLAGTMKDYASSMIVENRAGAGGRVALEVLKTAAPDGSVFIVTPVPCLTLFPHIYKTLKYDPFKDFVPVTSVSLVSYLLTIGPKVPLEVKSLANFIAWCRANPSQATYGSPGAGTSPHLIGVALAQSANFPFTHVPYLGNSPASQDLLGGQIAASILSTDATLQYLSGNIRALATTGAKRSIFLADVPTLAESGYPTIELVDLWGVFVPKNTPKGIVDKLNRSIQDALRSDEVKAALARLAIEISTISEGNFERSIMTDFER